MTVRRAPAGDRFVLHRSKEGERQDENRAGRAMARATLPAPSKPLEAEGGEWARENILSIICLSFMSMRFGADRSPGMRLA